MPDPRGEGRGKVKGQVEGEGQVQGQGQARPAAMLRVRMVMELAEAGAADDSRMQEGKEMDPRMWSLLPPEILERVLLQLPLRELFCFRAVCKHWLRLLTNGKFLDDWQGLGSRPLLGVLLHRHGTTGRIGLPPSVRMISVGLSFLPDIGLRPIASAGGLLCLARLSEDASSIEQPLYVCHPVTRRSLCLPRMELPENYCPRFATLWVSEDRYKLFVGCGRSKGHDRGYHALRVYDSRASAWQSLSPTDLVPGWRRRGQVEEQDGDVEMADADGEKAKEEAKESEMQAVEREYCSCVLLRDFVSRISVPVCVQWALETWSFTRLEGVPFSVVQHRGHIYYVHAKRDVSVVRLYLEKEVKEEEEGERDNPSYVVAVLPEQDVKALCCDWKHVRRGAERRIVSSGDSICISFVHRYTVGRMNRPTGCRGLLCYNTELGTWRGWFAYFWDRFEDRHTDWQAVCAPFAFDLSSRHLV